ncbi:Uncharacterised protein [Nocardia africana]|uniref:Protein kinase domain-containing protein n=2 Tax=Nocardia africana TaxID=134964 RepID=A0A378WM60_9NOCA|nr:Uncharacterised protein [Nocardia africana]
MRAAVAALREARRPEDLFGAATTDSVARRIAHRTYLRLAAVLHPDRVSPTDAERATAAFVRLGELYRSWLVADQRFEVCGTRGRYRLGALHARGSVADLYRTDSAAVVVKVARRQTANSLLANERNALTDIAALTGEHKWLAPYYPRLIDTVDHTDTESGEVRAINVLGALTGEFVTLAQVRAAYPQGLDPRDYAWMHRRLLRCLAGAATAHWVHTAVSEENVLIHPRLHGVVLVGWSFATRPGRVPAATPASIDHPPETGSGVSPSTDVYLAHRLLLTMLGDRAPAPMRAFAEGCLHSAPRLRPDARTLLDEFDDLLDRLYGARRFRPFELPKGQ